MHETTVELERDRHVVTDPLVYQFEADQRDDGIPKTSSQDRDQGRNSITSSASRHSACSRDRRMRQRRRREERAARSLDALKSQQSSTSWTSRIAETSHHGSRNLVDTFRPAVSRTSSVAAAAADAVEAGETEAADDAAADSGLDFIDQEGSCLLCMENVRPGEEKTFWCCFRIRRCHSDCWTTFVKSSYYVANFYLLDEDVEEPEVLPNPPKRYSPPCPWCGKRPPRRSPVNGS